MVRTWLKQLAKKGFRMGTAPKPVLRRTVRLGIEALEDRTVPSITVSNGLLTVTDGVGTNAITLSTANNGVTVNLNGSVTQFSSGQINSIRVIDSGTDTVNVERTLPGAPLTISEGSSKVTVNISPVARFLDNIQGNVTVHGGTGVDTLNINDQNDSFNDTYSVTDSSVTRNASAAITYDTQHALSLNSGSGAETVNVLRTAVGATTNLVSTGSGLTTVNVGNAGSVQGIRGALNIEHPGPSGGNAINLNDSADTASRTVTLSSLGSYSADSDHNSDPWGQVSGLAPAAISYEYADTSSLTIQTNGGSSGNTINVLATGATTNLVSTGTGLTTVNVGNAGSVQSILGPLDIEHPGPSGGNAIIVNDSADTTSRTITLSSLGSVSVDSDHNGDLWGQIAGLAPAAISYEYADTSSLTVQTNGGCSGNTINVLATGATTNLVSTGSGLTTVNVGNAGSVQGILGALNIEHPGPSGGNAINLNDLADTTSRTVTLTSLGSNPTDPDPWGQISGLAPAAINFEYPDTSSLTVHTGFSSAATTPSSMVTDAGGKVFSLQGNTVYQFNGSGWSPVIIVGLDGYPAPAMARDSAGNVFVMENNGHVLTYNSLNADTWIDLTGQLGFNQNPPPHNLVAGGNGNVFMLFYYAVYQASPDPIWKWTKVLGDPNVMVQSLVALPNGTLLALGNDGIVRYSATGQPGTWVASLSATTLANAGGGVEALAVTPNGVVYALTRDGSLAYSTTGLPTDWHTAQFYVPGSTVNPWADSGVKGLAKGKDGQVYFTAKGNVYQILNAAIGMAGPDTIPTIVRAHLDTTSWNTIDKALSGVKNVEAYTSPYLAQIDGTDQSCNAVLQAVAQRVGDKINADGFVQVIYDAAQLGHGLADAVQDAVSAANATTPGGVVANALKVGFDFVGDTTNDQTVQIVDDVAEIVLDVVLISGC
jgi:hypothetical protein